MKILGLTCTEEMVLNPDYKGMRYARIEAFVEGEHYRAEVGKIEVWNNDELFMKAVEAIEKSGD